MASRIVCGIECFDARGFRIAAVVSFESFPDCAKNRAASVALPLSRVRLLRRYSACMTRMSSGVGVYPVPVERGDRAAGRSRLRLDRAPGRLHGIRRVQTRLPRQVLPDLPLCPVIEH